MYEELENRIKVLEKLIELQNEEIRVLKQAFQYKLPPTRGPTPHPYFYPSPVWPYPPIITCEYTNDTSS